MTPALDVLEQFGTDDNQGLIWWFSISSILSPLYAIKIQILYMITVNAEKLVVFLNNEENSFDSLLFSE